MSLTVEMWGRKAQIWLLSDTIFLHSNEIFLEKQLEQHSLQFLHVFQEKGQFLSLVTQGIQCDFHLHVLVSTLPLQELYAPVGPAYLWTSSHRWSVLSCLGAFAPAMTSLLLVDFQI